LRQAAAVAQDVLSSLLAMTKGIAALLLVAAAASGTVTSPRDVVQRSVTRVVQLVDASGNAAPSETGVRAVGASVRRRVQIRMIADELFDFEEVSRRALSVHWAARTAAERAEFVALFTDLLEGAYLGKIESYTGERIVYTGEKVDGDYAAVRSQVISRRRDYRARPVTLEYRLWKRDGRWKVYDLLIDGVSFVSTYRSQFDRIIQSSSYTALLDRLRDHRPETRMGTSERP
jgi:phospholipid transport system substrate-binding protein